jgi:translation initiation factor 1A
MGINKKGGKKHKKGKSSSSNDKIERELSFKSDDQEYAQIIKLLGNCRIELKCIDGKTRLGIIRGTMKKKVWLKVNDIVLVSLRPFEDNKCDILFKYETKEVKRLKILGEIPDNVKIDEEEENEKDIGIDFTDGEEDDDENENKKEEINIDLI